jgi:hypothetical protein
MITRPAPSPYAGQPVARPGPANSGQCASLRSDLATLQSRARAGGSVATMERINNERRQVDSQISSAKCS